MAKALLHEDPVIVPDQDDMDNETFLLHLEARHTHEVHTGANGKLHRHAMEAWIGPFRTFHRRLHDLAAPGQYDHIHEDYL